MADLNKNENVKPSKNVTEIIGEIKENKVEFKDDKNKVPCIMGSLVIQYGSKADQVVEIEVFTSSQSNNKDTGGKKENKNYAKRKALISNIVTIAQAKASAEDDEVETLEATKVMISGNEPFTPQTVCNTYASNGSIVQGIKVQLGFGNLKETKLGRDAFKGEFENEIYLAKNPKVKSGEDKMIVEGYTISYKGELTPMSFVVYDEDLIDGIGECSKGDTIDLWGDIKIANIITAKKQKSEFGGKGKTDNSVKTVRELVVVGGKPVSKDREISDETIKNALVEREILLEKMLSGASDKPKTKDAGFGGKAKKSENNEEIPF